ncbi:MAG: zinc ABC transporter substrate-binding protein, partial [Desulfuromonas sp.]
MSVAVAWAEEPVSPTVVVSIKPLHFLVSGVMEGVAEPQLLVKGGGSPHDYAMRPSEARMLASAALIVWVGPQLESFLAKPLTTLGQKARLLEFGKILEPHLLPVREGGAWSSEVHAHHIHSEQQQLARDPHFWLNPQLA